MTPSEIEHLRSWIGKTEEATDTVTPRLVRMLRATLFMEPGEPKVGDPVPWMTHWCFALDIVSASEIGADGHPKRGGFLPPVPLPRRMWAGGKTDFVDRVLVGDQLYRKAEIADVAVKSGSTGQLCFVTINHTISSDRGVAIRESQTVVYRAEAAAGAATAASATAAPPKPTHQQRRFADPVLLFRYSAVMFNGHRIHYDRSYVTQEEGYPGLVVHGPLIATLLIDLLRRNAPGAVVTDFAFKAVRPTYDLNPFTVLGQPSADGKSVQLWAHDHEGWLTMQATAKIL